MTCEAEQVKKKKKVLTRREVKLNLLLPRIQRNVCSLKCFLLEAEQQDFAQMYIMRFKSSIRRLVLRYIREVKKKVGFNSQQKLII